MRTANREALPPSFPTAGLVRATTLIQHFAPSSNQPPLLLQYILEKAPGVALVPGVLLVRDEERIAVVVEERD